MRLYPIFIVSLQPKSGMNMDKKKKLMWIGVVLLGVAVLVVWVLYINRSWTEKEVERAKVEVQQRVCFALMADGKDVAFFSRFSESDSAFVGLTNYRDSALVCSEGVGVWVNSTSLFPSANGKILVPDVEVQMETQQELINQMLPLLIDKNRLLMQAAQARERVMADEVDYYLLRHSIADNEYIGVANCSYMLASHLLHQDKMMLLLDSLTRHAKRMEVRVVREYYKDQLQLHPVTNILTRPSLMHLCSDSADVRFIVLQSDSLTDIPDTCLAMSTPLFLDDDFSGLIPEWHVRFYPHLHPNPLIQGTSLISLTINQKELTDSLYYGTSLDTLSNAYIGQMDACGHAQGYGVMRYGNGDYYEGEWLDGGRHGHGFLVAPNQVVKAGEWAEDKYLGEKMTYTDNRVYGIDISRYQHEIGRHVYPINWNAMRITSLGKKNSPLVDGTINFPVSFVYIKSTQGITIKSAYYQQDAQAARHHGIICGAYHFFSFKATGQEQAEYFLANTQILAGDMPPVLDVEPTDAQIEEAGGEEKMFSDMRDWLQAVERAVGKRPILYVSQNFVKYHLVHAPDLCHDYLVWIARYHVYRPDVRLLFWQLCYDGRVAGIHGGVDINIFNGYREQFDEFVAQQK